MKLHTRRFLAVYLLCLIFPLGVWLGLLGYEIFSFVCLFCGWTPIAYFFAMIFATEDTDENAE